MWPTEASRAAGVLMILAAGVVLHPAELAAQLDRSGPPTTANSLVRDTASVEAGGSLFRQYCTGCHGRGGEGGQGEGQGPNLATSWEVRRAKDGELFGFIKNGVKGTAMPAFPLPDDQIRQLAAFVRSLNAPAISLPVSGNVQAGEEIFFGKGQCSSCHMIRGRGGYLGPDLSDIGATRRLGELRDSLTNPSAIPSADYRPLLVTSPMGSNCVLLPSIRLSGRPKSWMRPVDCTWSTERRRRNSPSVRSRGCRQTS